MKIFNKKKFLWNIRFNERVIKVSLKIRFEL
jgi:hypothetical protein